MNHEEIPALSDRSRLLKLVRAEIVGPAIPTPDCHVVPIANEIAEVAGDGPIFCKDANSCLQEIVFYRNEMPVRKYGTGVLHPSFRAQEVAEPQLDDTLGFDLEPEVESTSPTEQAQEQDSETDTATAVDALPDPEIRAENRFKQSSMGISFCVALPPGSQLQIRIPRQHKFSWQQPSEQPLLVNGRYTPIEVKKKVDEAVYTNRGFLRSDAFDGEVVVEFKADEIAEKRCLSLEIPGGQGSPQKFQVDIRARAMKEDAWLITASLINRTPADIQGRVEATLFQSYFEVRVAGDARFLPYPSPPQTVKDIEKRSLELLYRHSKTWAIGHNCAGGWEVSDGAIEYVNADVMPVAETASMTPDIQDSERNALEFAMVELSDLPDSGTGGAWEKLKLLEHEYEKWIKDCEKEAESFGPELHVTAATHIAVCRKTLQRIKDGMITLRTDARARLAFRLANKAMLLQQLSTKVLKHRRLIFDPGSGPAGKVIPGTPIKSPYQLLLAGKLPSGIGKWRAFQLAFLLMNVSDFVGENESEFAGRMENIDLIWFPTGGGKTEAYLGVAAYSMFLQRLCQREEELVDSNCPKRDGTNILMRYTLRMLTTQQFQRAAALICAMECIRQTDQEKQLAGKPFSLGLWIGGDGSPNKVNEAVELITKYRNDSPYQKTNPLILTECPWCRSQLGRAEGLKKPTKWKESDWRIEKLKGIFEKNGVPTLCCSDQNCPFSKELPIRVIDEAIYADPPSLVIGTADKFAVISYRPRSRALFGRGPDGNVTRRPPNLIIQDELHLISGPLGTMFGVYESLFEELCTFRQGEIAIKPKVVCSTATIRGAGEQLRAIFGRKSFSLFPAPGLDIGDSFFGRFARKPDGSLQPGRMYVGVHAQDFISSQTTQVRVFSSLLTSVENHIAEGYRDPWWTNLIFYNSLRELGGATTLFQGDIKSRSKYLTLRDNLKFRSDAYFVELSSRLKQDEIIAMLDTLAATWPQGEGQQRPLDACLASNIIEVGVDIERLSLMCVVGQPKTTAQYIQVTGRVGRRWWERPGLVFVLYSPTKIRDKSHYEQFYSYHQRLYEQVEPTSATPFSRESLERAAIGAMLAYARTTTPETRKPRYVDYAEGLEAARQLLVFRCQFVESKGTEEAVQVINRIAGRLKKIWDGERDNWEKIPLGPDDSVLMRWPGQFATAVQKDATIEVPSSMRQVDASGELNITKHYRIGESE